MLANARAGRFGFVSKLRSAVEAAGWRSELVPAANEPPGENTYALHHMSGPAHPRVMFFRRTYYQPFWHIEREAQRWRWPVASQIFDPDRIDRDEARAFIHTLRQKNMPGLSPTRPAHILIPLQEQLTEARSFQTMSPVEMVKTVAATGRPCIATLHPRGGYSDAELAALDRLRRRHGNLAIGGDSRELLAGAEFIATQNSSVAMDAYLLTRPVVLFAQIDFHHIALNVAETGAKAALQRAAGHKAEYAKYLFWFLQMQSIDASSDQAGQQMLDALKRGGWPI